MKAEIINIGTEILLGNIVNTNASFISRELARTGIDVYYQTVVGDNLKRVCEVLEKALLRSDIVITTGGLGPTVDDITRKAISKLFNKNLILNKKLLKDLKKRFSDRHILMPQCNILQAYIPKGATSIKNNVGTAGGFVISKDNKLLIALPGVPAEINSMMKDVLSIIKDRFKHKETMVLRKLMVTGLAEAVVNQKVKDLLSLRPPVTVGIYAHPAQVDLQIAAKARNKNEALRLMKAVESKIRKRLTSHIFGVNGQTLPEVVGNLLKKKRLSISTAESCTAGFLAKMLTDISGSHLYFAGGLIAYNNTSKVKLLKIPKDLIDNNGAVSPQVAILMAKNAKGIFNTDLCLGITGIAGPTGATKKKPVGLVYIALACSKETICKKFNFSGDRSMIRFRACYAALGMLRKKLI